MIISNLQIRKTLQFAPLVLLGLILADLVLLIFVPEFFGGSAVNGYLTGLILALLVGFYAYYGYPMFTFDAKTDVLAIRSHLALSTLFGKTLNVPKMNITNLYVDTSGIRKKLVVTYINAQGVETDESFSITILSRRKTEMLIAAVEEFQRERSPKNLHLFI